MSDESRLNEIEARLTEIETSLCRIIVLIETNNESCKKMDDHIDFVESVYQRIKFPFSFFPTLMSRKNMFLK